MADLLSLSDDELYEAVGEYVAEKSAAARPPTKREIIKGGKEWVAKFRADFKKKSLRAKTCSIRSRTSEGYRNHFGRCRDHTK
jgi:hypothetical protein